MSDPIVTFTEALENYASMPHLLALTIAMIGVTVAAYGTRNAAMKWAKANQWTRVTLLALAVGLASWLWWTPVVGAPLTVGALLVFSWPAFRSLFRARSNLTRWRLDRADLKARKAAHKAHNTRKPRESRRRP